MAKGRYISGKFGIRATLATDLGTLDGMTYAEIDALPTENVSDANGEIELGEEVSGSYREGQGSNIVVSKTNANSLMVVGFTPAEFITFKGLYEKADVDMFIYNSCGGAGGYGSGICIRNKNITINRKLPINGVEKFELVWDKIYDTTCSEKEIESFDCAVPA